MKKVDVAIIGGGIAGCYTAYRLRQLYPSLNLVIIEAEDKLGGRAHTDTFYGTAVTPGAGVGRLRKDANLQQLVRDLNVATSTFKTGHDALAVHDDLCNVEKDFKMLRRAFVEQQELSPEPLHVTFKDFASPLLTTNYSTFVACTGFSDYEDADAADVFFHYGFDDTYTQWTAIAMPWSILIAATARDVPRLLRTRVTKLQRTRSHAEFIVTCVSKLSSRASFKVRASQVIIATTASALRALLPKVELYKHVHGQPFMKIYGAFDPESAATLAGALQPGGFTVLPDSPLQKTIRISDAVYMIAYSDNKNALELQRLVRDAANPLDVLSRLLETAVRLPANSLRLLDTRVYFWREGTHYYDPWATGPHTSKVQFIQAAQRPLPGVFVVGECVALHQGWVEGALESVENILPRNFQPV
jgi:glycine/D-amino acid oxidase-like deaminating enzyme